MEASMNDRERTDSLALLPDRYRLVLCDIWGCVHDGVTVFPTAAAVLERWRGQGRIVFLVTNAPRPASIVQAQLDQLGLNRAAYDAIVTSGDTGIAALHEQGLTEVGFIGTAGDRAALAETGLILLPGAQAKDVVCTGLPDGERDPGEEDAVLRDMLESGARLHCFNPDRIVLRGDRLDACAGAIAERYEAMGGTVLWYGKPYLPVYQRCLAKGSDLAGRSLACAEVVAVGDSLATDFTGAVRAGFDFVFVTHGIEGEQVDMLGAQELIRRFAEERDIRREPVAVVRELG
jgi:HAD superfamily hydrolase (TIGR01459 family)